MPAPPRSGTFAAAVLRCTIALLAASGATAQVVVNEVVALNGGSFLDVDGSPSDWVELRNLGSDAFDLEGCHLTNDLRQGPRWRFGKTIIPAGGYLVIVCSGKDRNRPDAQLHASFRLSRKGGDVALLGPDGRIVSRLEYGRQLSDISAGMAAAPVVGSDAPLLFFASPTPGRPNGVGFPAVAPRPKLSAGPDGLFEKPFSVLVSAGLSGEQANPTIRFTTDGTDPTATAAVVDGPIEISGTTLLKARTFIDGHVPSPVETGMYVRRLAGLAGFSSDLPLVVLSTFGQAVDDQAPTSSHLAVFEPGTNTRTRLVSRPTFSGRCTAKTRGSSTLRRMKKSYRIEMQDAEGRDRDVPLLGLPADSDWILYGPFEFDHSHVRNVLAYELSSRIGHYAPRTRFVELFVNTDADRLSASHYSGLYVLMETVKRGAHRVDVERLRPEHRTEAALSGGYMIKVDRPGPDESGFTAGGQDLKYVYPKERDITDPQRRWLKAYLDAFGEALRGKDFTDPETGYARYIDVDSFIDFHFFNEYVKNPDSFTLSTFMHKRRGQKLRMGPQWDFDRAMRTNEDPVWVGRPPEPTGWTTDGYYGWWGILFRDPVFRQRYRARGRTLLANELHTSTVHAIIDRLAAEIRESMERNRRRWPIVPAGTWENDIEALKDWIVQRDRWFRAELLEIPVFVRNRDTPPLDLEIRHENASGTIHYTLDGSDPVLANGKLSPRAHRYERSIRIEGPVSIKARVAVDGLFSRLAWETLAEGPAPRLVVSEIMYNARGSRAYEYIEVWNVGDSPVELDGITLTGRISFNFSLAQERVLQPGQRLVVAHDPRKLASRYDTTDVIVCGPYLGRLSDTRGRLVLRDRYGRIISDVAYRDSWYPETDGKGRSLVLVDPGGGPIWNERGDWRPSADRLGTPGR